MFKTLVATTLLAFSSGSQIMQHQNATGDIVYQLYGSYCLKDQFNDECRYITSDTTIHYYDYTYYQVGSANPMCLYYDLGATQYYWINVRDFSIRYNSGSAKPFSFNVNLGESSIYENNLFGNTELSTLHEDTKRMILYFPQVAYTNKQGYDMFRSLFTGYGNAYCTYYKGYYTFLPQYFNTSYWEVYGSVNVDNNLYNNLKYDNKTITADLLQDLTFEVDTLRVATNGVFEYGIDTRVLFDGTLINNSMRLNMEVCGTFNYVYEPVNYTFGDMIFSVIDAPIYMLSQLFSFELFGIQFYVAFMSIMTLIIICCLVRKFI